MYRKLCVSTKRRNVPLFHAHGSVPGWRRVEGYSVSQSVTHQDITSTQSMLRRGRVCDLLVPNSNHPHTTTVCISRWAGVDFIGMLDCEGMLSYTRWGPKSLLLFMTMPFYFCSIVRSLPKKSVESLKYSSSHIVSWKCKFVQTDCVALAWPI